jgi:uncharacterized protein YndB with AHSA1/START domain
MATIRAEIEIDAPAERIFEILTDLEAYSEWNPLTPRVESALRPGDPVHLHVRLRGDRLSHRIEIVSANEKPSKLCWGTKIGARFRLTAERCQTLTPLDQGRTRYVSEDVMRGWLTPIVMIGYGRALRRGFCAVAVALKTRVES